MKLTFFQILQIIVDRILFLAGLEPLTDNAQDQKDMKSRQANDTLAKIYANLAGFK